MPSDKSKKPLVILILGLMTALSPFTIDMYLPAFGAIATEFHTTVARISLSLSSYFVGLSVGQIVYGPLLDRFGRKRPLYYGLSIYAVASFFCILSKSTESLVFWRFVQAAGGCAVGVGSMAMVRDLFTVKESAKIYSLLILILGASPLLAPTVGGILSSTFGWRSVFMVLIAYSLFLIVAIRFVLGETSPPNKDFSLRVGSIASTYFGILKNRTFQTFAMTGAIAFSGLFVYLAGSPVIFLEQFKVSEQTYGIIFAVVAAGMILASQANVQLLKRYSSEQLFFASLIGQVTVGCILLIGVASGQFQLIGIVATMFFFMFCFGLTNPNGGPLAMEPFARSAGSAAAMMGFLQMTFGALASTLVGVFSISEIFPVLAIITGASGLGLFHYLFRRTKVAVA